MFDADLSVTEYFRKKQPLLWNGEYLIINSLGVSKEGFDRGDNHNDANNVTAQSVVARHTTESKVADFRVSISNFYNSNLPKILTNIWSDKNCCPTKTKEQRIVVLHAF
jgi:hypothetical protein